MPPSLKPAITFAEKKDLDPAKLVRLYQQAPWAKGRTLEDAREMLRHTDVTVTAWDCDLLIGFGRVLTDYVYRATIWDVIVDKAYQGQGIGADIVQRILNHPRLKNVELAIAGKPRNEETAKMAGDLAVEGAQTLRHNGYKVPLMRNLVKRAVRGSDGGTWTS